MATGKPVVATAIPAVESFRNLIYVAEDENQFVEQVPVPEGKDPAVILRKTGLARGEHSWEAHVAGSCDLFSCTFSKGKTRVTSRLRHRRSRDPPVVIPKRQFGSSFRYVRLSQTALPLLLGERSI